MFRLTIRNILSHKRRMVSTVLSIVLGIAFLAGTFVFTDSIEQSFDDLFASVYADIDAVVRSSEELETQVGTTRGRIPDTLVGTVADVPGVAEARGSASGYARILSKDGDPLGVDQGSPNFGMDVSDSEASAWTFVEGRVPVDGTEMAMDRGSFEQGDFALGDPVTVVSQQGPRTFAVVGVVRFGSADSPGGSRVALFDLATAQAFVGQPGMLDSIDVRGDGSADPAALVAAISDVLPAGTEVRTGQEIAEESSNLIEDALSFLDTLLLVFAFIALFVGSFIIYNTFSIVVAQRKRENALLRAIGASERQVESALLGEALVMGVVGSALGFVAGFGMARLLKGMLDALGIEIPTGGLVLLPRTVIVSFVVGTVITVAAAVLPARRGAKVPPIAAMRDVAVEPKAFSTGRLVWGLIVLAVGIASIMVGLAGELAVLGIGTALLFVGIFVLGPLIARPVASVLGAPVERARGMAGALARQNAMRNPKRTARTAAALVVGVALVSTITVFAASIKSSIRSIIGEQFTGDYVVATKTFGFGGLPSTLSDELGRIDGVAAAAGIQIGGARIDGTDQTVTVIDPHVVGRVFDLGLVAGSIEALDDTGILLSADRSASTGLGVGDTVTAQFLDGSTHTLTVQGVYDKEELAGPFSISSSLYASTGADMFVFSIFLRLDDGASATDVESALDAALAPYPMAELQSREGYIDAQAASIDTLVNLIYGLLALAVVIAVFGISNTLSLSVYERTRELGLLRAVGATRGQVRSMIRWESVITALLGAVQGVVVGSALGYAVVVALRDQGFEEFTLPIGTLGFVLLVGILCGVIAAARPARRAARLEVLAAIASE